MLRRIFISYTVRDGIINKEILENLKIQFSEFSTTFIDMLDNDSIIKQERIFEEIKNADEFILIKTPKVFSSPWVRKEIEYAKKHKLLIKEMHLHELQETYSWI